MKVLQVKIFFLKIQILFFWSVQPKENKWLVYCARLLIAKRCKFAIARAIMAHCSLAGLSPSRSLSSGLLLQLSMDLLQIALGLSLVSHKMFLKHSTVENLKQKSIKTKLVIY